MKKIAKITLALISLFAGPEEPSERDKRVSEIAAKYWKYRTYVL